MAKLPKTRVDVLDDWGEPSTPTRLKLKRQNSREVAEALGKVQENKPKKKGTSFYLDKKTKDILVQAAKNYNLSQSEVVIQCIHAFFEVKESEGI